jgi:prepilin-type N-terminal cleavage/methylation domain-containing protein
MQFNQPPRRAAQKNGCESGFTLIEVSMVLMILGLLLGGIIKGQEVINSAKTKGLVQDFLAVQTALQGYQDRYRATPGDDRNANNSDPRASVATTPVGMIGNGRIDGLWDSTNDSDESRLFWQHVRLAGFLAGPVELMDPDYAPQTQLVTKLGISSTMQFTEPTVMNGLYNVCTSGVAGRIAKHLDIQIDDGNTLTGWVRAASESAPHKALPTKAIEDDGKYVVCLAF